MKEKAEVIKENQSLLKQMEDLKSSQKTTSETALEQAVKEKDFRIQTLERTLEKERDDNKKEKENRKKAEKIFTTAVQNVRQDKKQVEESMEKHRLAMKEVIEHYPGLSSQIPPVSALEDIPPRPAKVKMTEEGAVATLPKQSAELRRPGGRRSLVRPTLEHTEEPQADVDSSAFEGSTVGQDKGGSSLEHETSSGVPVLQPSSRKRLISSSQMIDSTSQGDANPPLKKPKEVESSQGTTELKNGQPPGDAVAAQVGVLLSTDDQDDQQPTEEMDTDQASVPIEEVEATREDDVGNKDDTGAHVDASMDIKGRDTDFSIDIKAPAVEDTLAKSDAVVEPFDEDQKIEDLKEEAQLPTATDVEDEMEEGELPEEPEQPLDGTALGEAHRGPTPSDAGEQGGNDFRASSPGRLTEKSDVEMLEIGDTTAEPDRSSIAQLGGTDASPSRTEDVSPARERSPNPVHVGVSSEQRSTSTITGGREPSNPAQASASSERNTSNVTEGAETRSRTINLSERAMKNRQARILRSQQSPAHRKDAAGRGSRGRSGRGQT